MRVVNVRRNFMGATELIELGQGQPPINQQVAYPTSPGPLTAPVPASSRIISVSATEADLILKTVKNIVDFAGDFPIEFHSYCPTERWQETLNQVGTWSNQVEQQLKSGAKSVNVPAEAVFRLVDLEKCASAARESRLKAAKWAFGLSAAGTLANVLLGLSWVTVPTYLAGLGILFGGPLIARLSSEPQDPYKPSIGCTKTFALGGCAVPHETDEEKSMIKLIERVVLAERPGMREHWWGTVNCNPGGQLATTCLQKGRLRVRVEGWEGDMVTPAPGIEFASDCEDKALNVIGVYEVDSEFRETGFGPLPEKSRHPETYWVEYTGPKTGGKIRRAGPFGCPLDTRDHAIDDGGITEKGQDGDYVLMDVNGEMVPVEKP